MLKWRFWEFLGIFLMVFCMLLLPTHSLPRPFLGKWKLLTWYICHASFIHIWHVIPKNFSKTHPKSSFLWLVFRVFLTTLFYALRATSKFLAKWKVSWRYIILTSFISIAFVVAKLRIFKYFRRTVKVDFRLLLGGFLDITPPNAVRFS